MNWNTFAIALLVSATAPALAQIRSVTLEIDKMDCAACPITVRVALEKVPGTVRAKVDYRRKLALVEFDAARTSPTALARASTDAGYPAKVREAH